MHDPFRPAAGRERAFLSSAGSETYLLFQQRFPLREFCAFEVFDDDAAIEELRRGFLFPLLDAAHAHSRGLLLDTLVWRAHPDFIGALGRPATDLARVNELAVAETRAAVEAWRELSPEHADQVTLLAADIGPRGDGYKVAEADLTADAAQDYHRQQLAVLAGAGIDLVCALTMTTPAEAIGIARAAAELGRPIVISATVETDGRLPDGSSLGDFIGAVDDATGGGPLFYMVNCAHPNHLSPALEAAAEADSGWLERFKGFRSNASDKSHEELDESTELDRGDPRALAREVAAMQRAYSLRVVGGCCGTDAEHIAAIAAELD